MKIQIAGPGCPKCRATEEHARQACATLGLEAEFEHLTDPRAYAPLGVMLTPAVLVDGQLLVSGHVPTTAALQEALAAQINRGR
jgi:small redox-active disulfide protein 2